jgi:hypothetical protein
VGCGWLRWYTCGASPRADGAGWCRTPGLKLVNLGILTKKRASVRAPRTEEELSLHNGQQAVARAACERVGRFAGGRNGT